MSRKAALAAVVLVCGFSALGVWQLQRLARRSPRPARGPGAG
jgi:cytochrome oxidase assembly protein ShyY1